MSKADRQIATASTGKRVKRIAGRVALSEPEPEPVRSFLQQEQE